MAKKAFLVGINTYSIDRYNLRGCVNDVNSLRELLNSGNFGFANEDIAVLLNQDATDEAIITGLTALLADAATGDTLIFGYSGHGTQKGLNVGGEITGRDQAIVPYNVNYNSLIIDDRLNDIISEGIGDKDLKFSAIYDCCHSGTMGRPLTFNPLTGDIFEDDDVLNRCLPLDFAADLRDFAVGPYNILSACQDEETAADLRNVGGGRGAFSFALHQILQQHPALQMREIEDSVLQEVKRVSKHPQKPNYFARSEDALPIG